jgi:hypothetical protein
MLGARLVQPVMARIAEPIHRVGSLAIVAIIVSVLAIVIAVSR